MTTRRSFLKQAGIVTAGAWLMPHLACTSGAPKGEVGIQLYTVRDVLVKDQKTVLAQVAKAGYTLVEPFGFNKDNGYFGMSTKDLKKVLDDNGLKAPSGHYDINSYFTSGATEDLDACIQACHDLSSEFLTIPSLSEEAKKDPDTCKKTAETMTKVAEILKKEDLKLAYHNHNTEFTPFGDTYGYEIFLKESDPKLVFFEMDLYWLVRAGKKPDDLFKEFPGRFPMWHVKDMDKANPDQNTEIGNGSINFVDIFEHSKESGMKHFFVEQENNYKPDIIGSIAASNKYIKETLIPKLPK
ncbi:Sugar phosphate isomerase/epimerase [Arachidicoccus rhizosphaerae]|uniref:Sugar phosphate isomerase/epimerase n=1 Tax=Arachidicoccus rhizosphaerae TaxID=551991 RepID=A0A1H3VFN2_9BACT|nr:sugar phosphate isomerase/epimerase family protein [Arachidicoccus rhizosphaerae]SDZ73595.1 Sugar phosphate isomerase/epimerase [Arachidicoccus rhizosphaerae]